MERRFIYLDNAATTPVDPRVLDKMTPYFTEKYANPATKWTSSLSLEVDRAVEDARRSVAKLLNADVEEIYFTSGGTESDNASLKGIAFANREKGDEIISTPIEHEAVLKSLESLERSGFRVKFVRVDRKGFVDPDEVRKLITRRTILVSVMFVNNEIGTVEPISEIGKICKERGVYFHTDAVQAAGHLDIDVKRDCIDLLSLSAHKFYGPKGVGALYVRKGTNIIPFMDGGGQERGLRSGTLNTTGIIGLGAASELAMAEMEGTEKRIAKMRNELWKLIAESIPKVFLNGPELNEQRIPNNLNFVVKGVRNEPLLVALNESGIIAGGGSACAAGSKHPSHVLRAIGVDEKDIFSGIRITFGKFNDENDIGFVAESLKTVIRRLRDLSPDWLED